MNLIRADGDSLTVTDEEIAKLLDKKLVMKCDGCTSWSHFSTNVVYHPSSVMLEEGVGDMATIEAEWVAIEEAIQEELTPAEAAGLALLERENAAWERSDVAAEMYLNRLKKHEN